MICEMKIQFSTYMESAFQILKEEANRIRKSQIDNFYLETTKPMNIPIKTFLSLFNIIHNSQDDDLILGFCFSIGPYISNNRTIIKSNYSHEIWANFITFSEIINDPIQVFGFCEAVLTASFCFLSIDQSFLDFLVDNNKPLKSTILKPSLLVSLYSDFDVDFIPRHSKELISMITEFFNESIPIHCILNLYLVNLLNFTSSELKNYPNFEKNLWSSVYRVVSVDSSYFGSLLDPLFKFRKLNESFFSSSNEFISSKIDEIVTNSYQDENMNRLVTLAYLMPFFSVDDVEKFMNKVIPIVSLYLAYRKKIPKELTSALNESKNLLGVYSVAMKLYSVCSTFLETEFYPAVIYFLSIFLNAFKSHYPQCYIAIIEKFMCGLESSYPIKFPLCFAFYQNAKSITKMIHEKETRKNCESHHHHKESDEICHNSDEKCHLHHKRNECEDNGYECCHNHHDEKNESDCSDGCKCQDEKIESCCCNCHNFECSENLECEHLNEEVLKSRVIPALLKISCCKNGADSHWAFKTLRIFLNLNCFDLFPSLSNLFEFYSLNPESDFSEESVLCLHHFYKFLIDYVDVIKLNENQFNEVINFTYNQISFINSNSSKFVNKDSSISLIKTDQCNLIRVICTADSSFISNFFDFGMKFSSELFFSDNSKPCSSVIQLLSLFYNEKKKSEKDFVSKIRPFINHCLKIGKNEVHSCSQSRIEFVSHLVDFDFVNFSDVSEIVSLFIAENDKETKDQFNLVALQIIENFLKKLSNENHQKTEIFELIISPFLKQISILLRSSRSEKVVNKSFSILTIILDLNDQVKNDQKTRIENDSVNSLIDFFEDIISVTLFGRIRLFDHSTGYNYGFLSPGFKFFSFASHLIAKYSKKLTSRRITDDFTLWILRVSNEVVPKILKVLEISLAVKIIDSEMIEFLSATVVSRINEDNWKLDLVDPCVSFLKKLKEKFPAVFPINSFLACLEKAWEENQDDNPEIVKFLIPVFLQTFSEKSFNISGDFLVFQEISTIVAAETFDLNYPQLLNYYVQMYQNKIPFDSFDKCASVVFTHFLTKNKSELIESGFSIDALKTMHMMLKQIFKNNKSVDRFIDNYFVDNSVVSNRIKTIKKSPKLPEF